MQITIHQDESNDYVIEIHDFSDLGHEICMGIRHGLFGGDATDTDVLADGQAIKDGIVEAAQILAEALMARKQVT